MSVHAPGGEGTRPSSTPPLVTSMAPAAAMRRRPDSGSARPGRGRGGTVGSSGAAVAGATAQSTVAVRATGW